jgi:hypothetical protein
MKANEPKRKMYYTQSMNVELFKKLMRVSKKEGVTIQLFVELTIKNKLDKIFENQLKNNLKNE